MSDEAEKVEKPGKSPITMNMTPEQVRDPNLQAFLRQMALDGTPVVLNFFTAGLEKEIVRAVNKAELAASRAEAVEQRIQKQTTRSAPPTYSEG
jgi:hypothetical protein